jgi:hypothetical protein
MSGQPTEAELQTIWSHCVDMLEKTRVHGDDVLTAAGGEYDTIIQSLEGSFVPTDVINAVTSHRATYSSLVDPSTVLGFLSPILFEYASIMSDDATDGFGAAYTDLGSVMIALYEWFIANSLTVKSRAITYDTTSTKTGTGNGDIQRLTADENGFDLEACHVEKKTFRCRSDARSGVAEYREVFEHLGVQGSFDALQRAATGSGESARAFIRNHHAGTGTGGSLLKNASFSTFDATATPQFAQWDLITGTQPTQDATNYYIDSPGSATPYGMACSTTFKIRQTLANLRVSSLNPDVPYFCRLMFKRFNSADGTLTIRCGAVSESVTLAAQTNWNELRIGTTTPKDQWFKNFNEDGFDIEIEWSGRTVGDIVIDDVIFDEYDLIDGTWWFIRHNHATTPTSWLVDDTLQFTDTGGAPATGKVQWYLFVSGLGYLPSSGTPTFADP